MQPDHERRDEESAIVASSSEITKFIMPDNDDLLQNNIMRQIRFNNRYRIFLAAVGLVFFIVAVSGIHGSVNSAASGDSAAAIGFGVASAVSGIICMIFSPLAAFGRDFIAEHAARRARAVPEQAQAQEVGAEEIMPKIESGSQADITLKNLTDRASCSPTDKITRIKLHGVVADSLDSSLSIYRLAAYSFLKFIPNHAKAKDIIDLANYLYCENGALDENIVNRMDREAKKDFFQFRNDFRGSSLRDVNFGPLGTIKDSRITQILLLSSVAAAIIHKEKFFDDFLPESDEEKAKKQVDLIETGESGKIIAAFNQHLLDIYRDMQEKNNQSGQLAALYGYKFVRDGAYSIIGTPTPVVAASGAGRAEVDEVILDVAVGVVEEKKADSPQPQTVVVEVAPVIRGSHERSASK